MPKRRRMLPYFFLFVIGLVTITGGFWFGLVPQRLSPFSPLSLDEPSPWFLDPRLATLRNDRELCRVVLKGPQIAAEPIADKAVKEGCGWANGVRLASAGGAAIGAEPLTCEMAAALTLWMAHEVQPLAVRMFGQRVASVQDMGTYSCRNIVGNPLWKNFRSQHAIANAFDIGGFTLEDGRNISVLRNWKGPGREARFLRAVHRRACRYFRVAL